MVVNCAAIPENLLEDELFGHVRGAFTDASRDREGLLAAAHTGTLFLDEIGELPLPLQAKLLRVLQSQEFRRIGDDHDRRVDARIITATNRELEQLVARGGFRQDLYYRINVFPLHLRRRCASGPTTSRCSCTTSSRSIARGSANPSTACRRVRSRGSPPTNFRATCATLENKIHQAMVIAAGSVIDERDVALPRAPTAPGHRVEIDIARPFRDVKQETIDAFERGYLTELLRVHRGNLAAAARAAGMDRKNLWARRHASRPRARSLQEAVTPSRSACAGGSELRPCPRRR